MIPHRLIMLLKNGPSKRIKTHNTKKRKSSDWVGFNKDLTWRDADQPDWSVLEWLNDTLGLIAQSLNSIVTNILNFKQVG